MYYTDQNELHFDISGGRGEFGPHSCWMPPYIGTWENPTSQYVLRVLDYYLGRQT